MGHDELSYFGTQWRYNGSTGDGLQIYENKENGQISLYNPLTGDIVED